MFVSSQFIKENDICPIEQWSPSFLAPRIIFRKASFSTHGEGVAVRKDASAWHSLCALLLLLSHQLPLRSPGVRCWRLGTSALEFPGVRILLVETLCCHLAGPSCLLINRDLIKFKFAFFSPKDHFEYVCGLQYGLSGCLSSWGVGMDCVCVCALLCRILCDPYLDCSPPGSMGFSRQEYWTGLPLHSPGDLPDPGIEHVSLASPALAGRFFTYCTMSQAWIQLSSVAQSCLTLYDHVNHSTPGLPVHHQLLEFIQTHIHRAGDAIQPSHPPSSPSPPAPNPSQHQGLFQ